MENFNNVPSSGTFGSVVSVVNQNFALAKEAIDKLSFSKSACMGFYETSSELNDAHPIPTDGDWALVGNSSPFNVYVANNGSWVDSGVDYNVSIDNSTEINGLGGYVVLDSVQELPASPSNPNLGYLIGTHLYVYVGTGGDALDGKYKDCGEFKGPQGEQGNSGYSGAAGELEVVNNLTDGGETAALSAEMGYLLGQKVNDVDDVVESISNYFPYYVNGHINHYWKSAGTLSGTTSGNAFLLDVSQFHNKSIIINLKVTNFSYFNRNGVQKKFPQEFGSGNYVDNGDGTYTLNIPEGVDTLYLTGLKSDYPNGNLPERIKVLYTVNMKFDEIDNNLAILNNEFKSLEDADERINRIETSMSDYLPTTIKGTVNSYWKSAGTLAGTTYGNAFLFDTTNHQGRSVIIDIKITSFSYVKWESGTTASFTSVFNSNNYVDNGDGTFTLIVPDGITTIYITALFSENPTRPSEMNVIITVNDKFKEIDNKFEEIEEAINEDIFYNCNLFRININTLQGVVTNNAWSKVNDYLTNEGSEYGWANMLTITNENTTADKAWIFDFAVANGVVAYFGSYGTIQMSDGKMSLLSVNFGTKKLSIHNSPSSASIPAVVNSADINVTDYVSKKFRIVISRKNRVLKGVLYDITIDITEVGSVTCNFTGAGSPCGLLYDKPCCYSLNGAMKLYNLECNTLIGNSKNCHVLIEGDSITEGWMTNESDTFGALLAQTYSAGMIKIAGRGAGSLANVMNRLPLEAKVNPKYVMVVIGTNNGQNTTVADYSNLISYVCDTMGAKMILCHIPRTNDPARDAVNEKIDEAIANNANKDVICVRMDVATSINKDISQGQDTSLFAADRVHPNASGYKAMYQQIIKDCPELFKNY